MTGAPDRIRRVIGAGVFFLAAWLFRTCLTE
jgi:hypothetical protein